MDNFRVDRDTWKVLLARAVEVLDLVERQHGALPSLTLGGGTVLMLRFGHRLSRDIDLFMYDAQWLTYFSPRLHDGIAAMVGDYIEQSSSLKLVMPEGDIDLVVAATVTGQPGEGSLEVAGRVFQLESTAEILAKKAYFRADSFRHRDVFDLATVIEQQPDKARRALLAAAPRLPNLIRRVNALEQRDPEGALAQILPLPGHEHRIATMRETVLSTLHAML